MNSDLHKFMFEWGPLITAGVCLIAGYIHARVACTATDQQKVVVYIAVLMVMFACVLSLQLDFVSGDKMLRGQMVAAALLGIPIPLLAGIGLFAWMNPDKMADMAEQRKYQRELRGKE